VKNSLTIKTNGTTAATFDGSSAASVNITPSSIGAASSSHSHSNYATISYVDEKLSNAEMTCEFDFSGNTITITPPERATATTSWSINSDGRLVIEV